MRLAKRFFLTLLALNLAVSLWSAQSSTNGVEATSSGQPSERQAKVFHPVEPGPTDGAIACLTARMLEELHYLKQPFDKSISRKFLDRYLESYDPQHVHFTQEDLAQFEKYRDTLGDLTVTPRGIADTRPSCEIFNRFMERLQQRVAYADELLKNDKFVFDADERILVNRKDQPYPKDLAEAKKLWRERIRYEYLQEHLNKLEAKKKEKTDTARKVDSKPKTESEEIVETLSRRYHRNLRVFTDWDHEDVLQVYLTALSHVYDPHTDYYGHAQLEGFAIGMNLSLSGIGAELTTTEDGYCSIRRLLPEGPAEKSKKINVKDRIIAVAQGDQSPVDVVEMRLDKAVQLIRGPKGTEVRLTVLPEGESTSKVVTLVRDEIKLEDQAAKAKIIDLPVGDTTNRLGVIDLPSFYAPFDVGSSGPGSVKSSTSADVARLLKKLKEEKVGGVILDLRRNGGGSLEEAIKLTGLFIKQGPVVQVRDSGGAIQVDDDRDPSVAYDGPLIVLTSRFSASASEIVAGALQDYGRALLVGDSSTHGKGTVQSVNNLRPYLNKLPASLLTNDPGALKLTIKKFYRASGASTQKEGVVPDIILPSPLNDSKEIGEAALENPLPYDTIGSAKFDKLNLVQPYLTELRKRSIERVAGDKDYSYIREDIELLKKLQADKTVSLNEKLRVQEKQEADARSKGRDKERLARPDTTEKTYEITLRQADVSGLPAPMAKTNAAMARLSRANSPKLASGVSTNSASVASQSSNTNPSTDSEEPDEFKPDGVDVSMLEAEHILIDYLSVLPKDMVTSHRRVD